ncbi:hypothetical protein BSK59_13540 [Paenibacillus odorifer]|uniref:hypothetical protein n=1 Tax=Paenibacillus odorifer TaxID=189426 RepID=UPI00096C8D9F|nr:hypothetical protein [Paenibacillus odorifer]OMD76842.1 hypothetical protein BSK50_13905 [Paenibacillus odorifer]OME55494.1 hypothetical protein BSK59_13540 [Paenibacillus odorifer]
MAFVVKTDEELCNKIDVTCSRLRHLFLYFQNQDTEMSLDDLERWHRDGTQIKEEIQALLDECDDRIQLVN